MSNRISNPNAFESQVRDCFAATGAFAFWKGRVALYTALKALGIGRGDAIMLPGYTCVVVPGAVKALNAEPIYVDIEPRTYNLNPDLLEECWTPDVRALIVQHTYGIPAEMDRIMSWAEDKGLTVIEDCCHSFGSNYRGRLLGTFGEAAFFSSQWSKPFTTGLGGLLAVYSEQLKQRVEEVLREAARPSPFEVSLLGIQWLLHKLLVFPRTHSLAMSLYNTLSEHGLMIGSSDSVELRGTLPPDYLKRMSGLQAWIGRNEFNRLDVLNCHRRKIADFYLENLEELAFSTVQLKSWENPIFLRYPIRVRNKLELLKKAARHGIELGSWFESPLHPIKSSLSAFGYEAGACPVAEQICSEVVNLPTHRRISLRQAMRTMDFVKRYAKPIQACSHEVETAATR